MYYNWAITPTFDPYSEYLPEDHEKPPHFHCTSWFVGPERDSEYEEKWLSELLGEKLILEYILISQQFSAFTVNLTNSQSIFFRQLQVQPHVSVGKKGSSWAEVGVWLTEQVEKGGWTWNDEGNYQNDAGVRAYPTMQKVTVHRLCSEERKFIPDKIDNDFDLLSGIPETLWAKDKFDIGQVKNAMPPVITPKTQYRPFRSQYPLSKEAVEGISKVHAALVEKGAIVPCQNSPINSPTLPVRKASGCHSPSSAPVCLVISTTLPRILLSPLLNSLPH